jgi:hypothetical protein
MVYDASILESWANGQNGLSTAQVAGLIAFAMFIGMYYTRPFVQEGVDRYIVNFLFNLIWPLITVALLAEQESAVTWLVPQRDAQQHDNSFMTGLWYRV